MFSLHIDEDEIFQLVWFKKICSNRLKDLKILANMILSLSVGDITPLKILHIRKMTGKGEVPYAFVIISWENADVKDPRTLIGYQVFYKES